MKAYFERQHPCQTSTDPRVVERWWEACSDINLHKPMPPDPAKQARRERFGGREVARSPRVASGLGDF